MAGNAGRLAPREAVRNTDSSGGDVHTVRRRTHQQRPPPPVSSGSPPSHGLSLFGLFGAKLGRLVVFDHDAVTSALAIAREQATNLLQRLLVVTSRVPIRLISDAHWDHLLRAGSDCNVTLPRTGRRAAALALRAVSSGEQSFDELGALGVHARAREDDVEPDLLRARLRRAICIRVERERANPAKLSAREHRVDECHPVNRIAARVDDEQVRGFLARIPHLGLACADVDVVAGRPGDSHKLGPELPVNDENDDVSHRGTTLAR